MSNINGAIYAILSVNAGVRALIGLPGSPAAIALYPFGNAPQADTPPQVQPYATTSTVGGMPANTLDRAAPADNEVLQFDCYSRDADQAVSIADAIRAALEDDAACIAQKLGATIDRFIGKDFENSTQFYRASFSASFWLAR
jgi:hypothetical protein